MSLFLLLLNFQDAPLLTSYSRCRYSYVESMLEYCCQTSSTREIKPLLRQQAQPVSFIDYSASRVLLNFSPNITFRFFFKSNNSYQLS
ncbi:hypothetical protein EB796_002933 [Bugula neritina]|uniref:Secreted protein n=1 Tax=Bugula neritina TaxID=10212 RepID=A0A7J7KKF1_BUGNE|nr:hypothetical protein EB796_002933 [Bugula neritina]